MLFTFELDTPKQGLVDITKEVEAAVKESGVYEGICVVFCPHSTASIIVTENVDSDLKTDFIMCMENTFPALKNYRHAGGNADAHIKSAIAGTSETLIVTKNKPLFGQWQGIYFCEFDGQRKRQFFVKVLGENS